MYLASSNKMYLVSDTFSCHTLHWNSCWSLNGYCPHSANTSQPNPQRNADEIIELCNLCTIWKCKDTFPKKFILLRCLCFTILLSDVFLPASCFCSVFSSARLWEPITAKPRSLLVFWFVELAQSLLRSFLFPVESLAGSVNCKMIGYSSSHENRSGHALRFYFGQKLF